MMIETIRARAIFCKRHHLHHELLSTRFGAPLDGYSSFNTAVALEAYSPPSTLFRHPATFVIPNAARHKLAQPIDRQLDGQSGI